MCWFCLAEGPGPDGAPATPAAPSAPRLRAEAVAAEPTAPRLHLLGSGHVGADGLLSGFAWALDDPVSFAFPDSPSDYEAFYGASEPARGFARIGPAMQDAVRRLLLGDAAATAPTGAPGSPGGGVAAFTGLALVESPQDHLADIRIARSSAPSTAWAYYPNAREGGDIWFGGRHGFDTPRLGTYQFATAIHEIGHALGLKHPHELWNGFAAMPEAWDGLEFTVMSYRSVAGRAIGAGYSNGTFDYPQSWMMLDIAALQHLYGADYGQRAGDTRYAWAPDTGETFVDGIGQGAPGGGAAGAAGNRVFLTVWDGGGTDTYDLSAYASGVAVDLAPGGHSVLSAGQLATLDFRDGTKARGNVFNALLHRDDPRSLIENAVGGTGADTLAGNAAANTLAGGDGDDLLDGREGADRLEGGAGRDRLSGGAGADTLLGGEGADRLAGGEGDDLLEGGAGAGVLDGGAGVDTTRGGAAPDIHHVDSPADQVEEPAAAPGQPVVLDLVVSTSAAAVTLPAGVELLRLAGAGRDGIGGAGPNHLSGGAAAERLDGAGGDDVIEGRGGADTLTGGPGRDSFVWRRGDGADRIEDFTPGEDRLVLPDAAATKAALLAAAAARPDGIWLPLEAGGVLLAWLAPGRLSAADLVL